MFNTSALLYVPLCRVGSASEGEHYLDGSSTAIGDIGTFIMLGWFDVISSSILGPLSWKRKSPRKRSADICHHNNNLEEAQHSCFNTV
jgi:hypothetical protein